MLLLCLLLAAAPGNPHLPRALEQIRALEESDALRTLQRARAWPDNTAADLARVHLYTGLAHAGLSSEARSIASFRDALLIDPRLTLPEGVSPRVQEWWKAAGGGASTPVLEPPPAPAPPVVEVPPQALQAPPAPPRSFAARHRRSVLLAGAGVLAGTAALLVGRQATRLGEAAREEGAIGHAVSLQRDGEQRARMSNGLALGSALLAAGAGVSFAFE